MIQAAKSFIKSNSAVSSLKDDNLYDAFKTFRKTSANQSELSTVDKALRNAKSSKEYNATLAEQSSNLSDRIARTDMSSVKGAALEERKNVLDSAQSSARNLSESSFQAQREVLNSGAYKKTRNREISEALNPATKKLINAGKGYFQSGDMQTNAIRAGAVASAYGVGAVGTRMLSGGSATTNNRGERDIAGIPFI